MNSKFGHVVLGVKLSNLPFYQELFSFLGWRELGRSATMAGLYFIYFTVPIGLIVGLIVCCTVSISRLRQSSGRPTPDSR